VRIAGDPVSAARMIGAFDERNQPDFALAFYAVSASGSYGHSDGATSTTLPG
jgi:hypothetical protein